MSTYVNVGASDRATNVDFPTKTALKQRMGVSPGSVEFYATTEIGPDKGKWYKGNDLPVGVRFSVTGPNPYTSRKWYATVEKLANGTIKVS